MLHRCDLMFDTSHIIGMALFAFKNNRKGAKDAKKLCFNNSGSVAKARPLRVLSAFAVKIFQ